MGHLSPVEPAAAGDAVRQKVVDGTAPDGHRAVGSPEKEPSSAEQEGPATRGFVRQQLLDLLHSLTSQVDKRDELLRQELSQQGEKVCALEQRVEQLQQDLQLEREQRSQQQLAQQAEVQGAASVVSHETISTVERLDRNARQANMFLSGVRLPAGGRGAMVRHVERLFTQHAPVTADAISHVTCLGPIRAAGPRCVIVKFRTIKEKLAAFQATSALRQQKVYLDDDITKMQQAARRQQEPERRRHQDAGRQTWWRVDRLHHSEQGHARAPRSQPALATAARGPTATVRTAQAAGRAHAAQPQVPPSTSGSTGRQRHTAHGPSSQPHVASGGGRRQAPASAPSAWQRASAASQPSPAASPNSHRSLPPAPQPATRSA